jgi:predicted TIM-barrel fold metal-dependent hydrolase
MQEGQNALLKRRDVLVAAAAAALMRGRTAFARASQPATPVNFEVPRNACDCHTHIFGDPARFPLWPGRAYTPEIALPAEMMALHRALHMERVVIVTPSVYGTDNSATLDGMRAYGRNARGIAVIDDKTPESAMATMAEAGIRGIRINLAVAGQNDPEVGRRRFREAVERVRNRGWHIQMFTSLAVISRIRDLVRDSPVPVVFDHFAGVNATLGMQQPGFADVLELVRSGKAYVKISGAYRASSQAPGYPDVTPFARALIAANADRIVWGTDWPHPDSVTPPGHQPTVMTPLLQIDDGRLLNLLAVWAPDPAVRKKMLVDNPARLYGF